MQQVIIIKLARIFYKLTTLSLQNVQQKVKISVLLNLLKHKLHA